MSDSDDLPSDAVSALHRGNKIEAIKIVRETRGIGLKEAKDTVEQYLLTEPALQRKIESAQAEAKRGCIWVLAIALALVIAGYYFLTDYLRGP